jgi:hypothetical protein
VSVSEYHSPDTNSTVGRVENYATYADPILLVDCVDEWLTKVEESAL